MTSFFNHRALTQDARKGAAVPRVGHLYLDTRRRLLHCLNETARQLVRDGVPMAAADLVRQPLTTLTGAAVTANDLPLQRCWREGKPHETTLVLTRPGGPVQHLHWSASPLHDENNQVLGIMASLTVAVPEPDWEALAGLTHDLRTPLQAMKLLVPLVLSTPPMHPDAQELLERLGSTAERALSIGMELLEWSRGPADGSERVSRSWLALKPLLMLLAGEQKPAAQRKAITLTTDFAAADGLEVQSHPVRLGRILSNLLSNAVRYTSTGQVRFVAAWRTDGAGQHQALALTVEDTGVGISAEEQESIFQPFERGKAGREGDSGSGLGLAVVDRLVEELGLSLEVFSEYGQGSTFDLLIPATLLRPTQGAADTVSEC
jgi:two-component system sensor histidine kinase EvgS